MLEEQEEKKPVSLRTNQLIRGQEFCGNRYIYLEMAVPDVFDWLMDLIETPSINEHVWRLTYTVRTMEGDDQLDDAEKITQEAEITAEILEVVQSAAAGIPPGSGEEETGTGRTAIEFCCTRGSIEIFQEHTGKVIQTMLMAD